MKTILQKCTKSDFEYLSEVLDSYISFTNDEKRKSLLEMKTMQDRKELIDLIDKQIRYYGSSDIMYLLRSIFSDNGAVSAEEIILDVADKLKVKIKVGSSVEKSLETIAKSVVERELLSKTPEELYGYFKKIGVGDTDNKAIIEFMKKNGTVTILPILTQILGPKVTFSILQSILITVISSMIGREAAKKIVQELLKRNPWLQTLGPVMWVISGTWLAFDLQGPAFRKTVPICLYLGIVSLRDGEENE